jgi:hypothetical protein
MGNFTSFPNDSSASLSSESTVHYPEDNCDEDSPSHAAYAKAVSDGQLHYLQSLSPDERDQVLGVAGFTPSERVKTIISDEGHEKPGRFLTDEEVALVVRDCYNEIIGGEIDENYVGELVFAIVDRSTEDFKIKGEGLESGLEQILCLASGVVKVQPLAEGDDGYSHPHVFVQHCFVDGIRELEEFGKKQSHIWRLSDKGRCAMDELVSKFGEKYGRFQYLATTPEPSLQHQG